MKPCAQANIATEGYLAGFINTEPDVIDGNEQNNKSKTNNEKTKIDEKDRQGICDRRHSGNESKKSTCDGPQVMDDAEYIMGQRPSSSKEKGIIMGSIVLPEVLPSGQDFIPMVD
jgi:hypothetical protein